MQNDAEFERLIERRKALESFIEETDTETIPSNRQRKVASLAADGEKEFTICEALGDKKVELKREYFAVIAQVLSVMDCVMDQVT